MATILDIGILEYFTPIFVFLFIFAVLYAILDKTGLLGENKGLKSLVAFVLAMMFILTQNLMRLVTIMTPWFIILIVAAMFIIMFFLFVGAKPEQVAGVFTEKVTVWVLLIVILIIFGYAITQVYGSGIHDIYGGGNATDYSGLNESIGKILFHPKMLGVLLILVIAAQAIRLIAGGITK